MQHKDRITKIVSKLNAGIKFGLFDDGSQCYFSDGEKVRYSELWIALRKIYALEVNAHGRTISELSNAQFEGIFRHSFDKHKWAQKTVLPHEDKPDVGY